MTEAEHRTQQFTPHMNMVAVPPAQLSPAVLHGSGGASTRASTAASLPASDGAGASAGGSRSEQLPSTQRWGSGHCSERSHGAPSGNAGGV
jgi:hypothetical protein